MHSPMVLASCRLGDALAVPEFCDQAFGEYDVETAVPSTGKIYRQTYAGHLVAENGKIKLLREALDTAAAERAFRKD
jgi:ketosteroid isomerase-like protein